MTADEFVVAVREGLATITETWDAAPGRQPRLRDRIERTAEDVTVRPADDR